MKMLVKKAFLLGGERQEPGTTVEVDVSLGRELVALGRAEPTQPIAPAQGPMTTNTASLVRGKSAKKE